MVENLEIVVLKANVQPVKGREVYWVFSKGQLEHIVQEVDIRPVPFAQNHLEGIAAWHGLVLPVVSLEKYFRFKPLRSSEIRRRALVKTVPRNGKGTVVRLLLNVPFDVRLRTIDTSIEPARISPRELEERGFKGIFEWDKDKLMIFPDLGKIASAEEKAL